MIPLAQQRHHRQTLNNSVIGVWSLGAVPENTSYQLNLVCSVNAAALLQIPLKLPNLQIRTQILNLMNDGDQREDDEDNAGIKLNFASDLQITKDDSYTTHTSDSTAQIS